MSEAKYQEALRLVRGLTVQERANLRVVLGSFKGSENALQSAETAPERSRNGNVDWLLAGVLSELKRRGFPYRDRQVKATIDKLSNYQEDATHVRGVLEDYLRKSIDRPRDAHFNVLGETSARSLANYLSPVIPMLGLRPMLVNINKTFEAIDRSFPGYLQAGMIGVLVQRKVLPSND